MTYDHDVNSMMKLKKIELIKLIINLSKERDELFDINQNLKQEIEEIETYEEEFYKLEEIIDLISRIKTERERASWGVSLARDNEIKLTEKLLDHV